MATDPYSGCILADVNLAVPPALCKHSYHSNQTLKTPESLNDFDVLETVLNDTFVDRQIHKKYLS